MATVTVIDEGEARDLPATAEEAHLWVMPADLPASGWERKPAGLCRGPECVPLPPGDTGFVRHDGAVDLAGLARHRGQVVVHDDARTLWLFDEPGHTRAQARTSLEAPDFTLPDLDGHPHTLSAYRGRKVLLASWASW